MCVFCTPVNRMEVVPVGAENLANTDREFGRCISENDIPLLQENPSPL